MAQSMTSKSSRPKLSFKDWFALPRVQKWFVIVTFAIVPLLLLLVFLPDVFSEDKNGSMLRSRLN